MRSRSIFPLLLLVAVAALAVVGVAAYQTRGAWQDWFAADVPVAKVAEDDHAHESPERIKLSPQAQANLRLAVKPLQPQPFRRAIQVPGVVTERRSKGDRGFVAPVAGVVKSVIILPGEQVKPGDPLAVLQVNSEALQASQTELYKTAQEIQITRDQKKRLESLAQGGAVSGARLLELEYQLNRLNAARKAYRADLARKGLTPKQIDQAEAGDFLSEITVRAPAGAEGDTKEPHIEVEQIKVHPGEQVQAGQLLGFLSNHENLYIEGRGFREDTALIEQAAAQGLPLEATFLEERADHWPPLEKPLTIRYLANTIDPTSQTFPFYVPLPNQFREYTSGGKEYRLWRFRPGQRVEVGVPVETYEGVFVLPTTAVVREGAETYVFRQNGDLFERRAVRVLHEDTRQVVVANDGSLLPGAYVARRGAEALNRALKARAEGGGGHGHHGHDH